MELESAAAWAGPYELQLAKDWTAEVAPADDAQVWAPAVGHPLQYASTADTFGSSCSLQPYVIPASSYSSGGHQQQLVEYNYYNYYSYSDCAAAAQHHDSDPMETYMSNPDKLFLERKNEFRDDAKLMKMKMHRYPPSIQALGDWCTVPKVVAIGPYYHRRDHLQKAEKMKHVGAQYCIEEYKKVNNYSGLSSVKDMYDAVVSVEAQIDACGLYDKEVMEGIGYEDDFLPMMFYDACFLLIYMLWTTSLAKSMDQELHNFFEVNDNDIAHDIMLLENQIPLQVVDAVMNKCTSDPLQIKKSFIAMWRKEGFLQDRADRELLGVEQDQDYYYNEAPHLLGLFRFYAVGERRSRMEHKKLDLEKMESISVSASAIELAEMGISLAANETSELPDMGLATKWIIFAELSMAALSLSDARASRLVNMAALELCTTPDFFDEKEAKPEDSAVCSYLRLFCMLLHREEDVHELRTKGILQGAGLTNNKTLDFFTSLQCLRVGRCYGDVMVDIKVYRMKKWGWWLVLYKFVYHNWKFIAGFLSALGTVGGIIGTLMNLKGTH